MKLIKLNIQNLYGVYTVQYKSLSCVRLFATPSTVAHLAPLSMEFSRQAYGVGCDFLLQRIFPTQGSNLGFLHFS